MWSVSSLLYYTVCILVRSKDVKYSGMGKSEIITQQWDSISPKDFRLVSVNGNILLLQRLWRSTGHRPPLRERRLLSFYVEGICFSVLSSQVVRSVSVVPSEIWEKITSLISNWPLCFMDGRISANWYFLHLITLDFYFLSGCPETKKERNNILWIF